MAAITSKYETIYVVDPTVGEEAVNELVEKFRALIESNATIEKFDHWGKRRLAYPINDIGEGYYTLIEFTSAHSFPTELERIFNITDGILRSIVIKLDE